MFKKTLESNRNYFHKTKTKQAKYPTTMTLTNHHCEKLNTHFFSSGKNISSKIVPPSTASTTLLHEKRKC